MQQAKGNTDQHTRHTLKERYASGLHCEYVRAACALKVRWNGHESRDALLMQDVDLSWNLRDGAIHPDRADM